VTILLKFGLSTGLGPGVGHERPVVPRVRRSTRQSDRSPPDSRIERPIERSRSGRCLLLPGPTAHPVQASKSNRAIHQKSAVANPGVALSVEVPTVGTPHQARAALYLRVSSEEQDLEGQERDLQLEASRRGWEIVSVFREKASATGKVERGEYERLRADARRPDRTFGRVLVWSLDRWSREASFVQAVGSIEELEAHGVRFHSLREPTLDSSEDGSPSMARDLLRAILPVISSFESRRKSERVRVAMRELKEGRRKTRSGRPVGRPRKITAAVVQRIREERAKGLAWSVVAQHVGIPAGTCRKVGPTPQRETPRAENPPPEFRTPRGGV
jgi:DNA invertase Pin-like site-specific DNA recombinase